MEGEGQDPGDYSPSDITLTTVFVTLIWREGESTVVVYIRKKMRFVFILSAT